MVGGILPVLQTKIETIVSSAPVAPSKWPVIDLVDPTTISYARSPSTSLIAVVSIASAIVEVP